MPYARYLRFIEKLALDLGGTVGSLGMDPDRIPFDVPNLGIKVGTAICYESIYGEYCTGYVKNGASLLFVITNDGWWKNTPGHRQHSVYASLRAIETRRSIARSANTGISAFYNQRGDIFQPTEYWVQDVIKQDINANDEITFYVKYGDYIARVMNLTSILLLLVTLSQWVIRRYPAGRKRMHTP
jgi:apolipoprotein N-acyltransferase